MPFQLKPQLYSLLLCSSAEQSRKTGGWLVQPFSELSVPSLPVTLSLTLFAQIMGPPGTYDLRLSFFHSTMPADHRRHMPPRSFVIQEGKNIDVVIHLDINIVEPGLHLLAAQIDDGHMLETPLRVIPTLK